VRRRYDAVIVGSGFGGGVTACRLAEAGWDVCVLERGREFDQFARADDLEDIPKVLWHPRLNPDGLLDISLYRDLWVICAAGVGGGSLAYANVMLRAKPDVFHDTWPAGIDCSELARHYDKVECMLQPVTIPNPDLRKARVFAKLAELAGLPSRLAPIAVYFGEGRERFGKHQHGCINQALCDVGCIPHAKNSIDFTYIARARQAGAEVHAKREVTELVPPSHEGGDWGVGFRELGHGRRHPTGWVEAPVVVLAAGTLGSTRLLLRNRRRLRDLSPKLGYRFNGNGDALAAVFDPKRPELRHANSSKAPVITSLMDLWSSERFIIEDGALPDGMIGMLDIVWALNGWHPGRLLLLLKRMSTYLGLSDRNATHRAVNRKRLKANKNKFDGHEIEHALVFLMMGAEDPNKRMKLTRLRRLDIREDRPSPANKNLFCGMRKKAELLAEAAGVSSDDDRDLWFPLRKWGPLGKYITVHPLGGCTMADSHAGGVVDSYGAVHKYAGKRGLFVLDGSIFPTASGVNPSMTIAALAERGAERLVAEGKPR
jgi:cholesterol oxidase